MKVEFYKHNLSAEDKAEALRVLDSIFLTTGDWTKRFEDKLARYVGSRHALGVTSCTNALELALRCYNIGPGDEVITTPMSFIATANAVEYVGAKPVFVDVEESTGNIDANRIEATITSRTKAILPVHLYGQLCDMRAIRALADKHKLKIIEDAAHCIEGVRDGARVGELGDIACYSFYATKNITSGEGGAVTTNDDAIANWLFQGRQHGLNKQAADRYTKRYEHYDMAFLGLKCNMSNILAALLLNQVDHIEEFLAKKETIAKRYDAGFRDNPYIKIPAVIPNSKHARHLYTIWVNQAERDHYLHALQDAGIGVAVNFRPIHLMKYYREKYGYEPGSFPIAEKIGAATISIPLYPKLTSDEVEYVIKMVNEVVKK